MRPDDDGAELIGAVLKQRWRIRRLLGAGGLGLVYEVETLDGNALQAVKLLRREFAEEPAVVERFLAEAYAAARIHHPGVPRIVECDTAEDGTPYIVMELCVGEPLSQAMNRGRFPVERAAAVTAAILETLTAAHAVGVVHRDLKPDNVFLVGGEGSSTVKVLDFGLARVMDVAGGPARKTRTGMLLGTPGYMSPEQVKNSKDAHTPADLFAVGVMLYEMLTGVRAFVAQNEFERMTKVLTESPTPIDTVAPHYAHWVPFFATALAREPAARFPDAATMRAALLQVAQAGQMSTRGLGATVASAPPPGALRATPFDERPGPARAGASSGPFGGVDTAVSPGVTGLPSAAPPASVAVEVVQLSPRGVPVWLTVALTVAALCFGLLAGFALGSR